MGRIGRGPEADLVARYAARLRPKPVIVEIPEARGSAVEIKRREAAAIIAALPPASEIVALDLGGPASSSDDLARWWRSWRDEGRDVCFVIGGAEGLDAAVLSRAGQVLSFGRLTWPHLLVRAMLAEQLFRAQSMVAGHPYHRSGRPD